MRDLDAISRPFSVAAMHVSKYGRIWLFTHVCVSTKHGIRASQAEKCV
jgi:hypothetical protein